jgi:hypothetical protein
MFLSLGVSKEEFNIKMQIGRVLVFGYKTKIPTTEVVRIFFAKVVHDLWQIF